MMKNLISRIFSTSVVDTKKEVKSKPTEKELQQRLESNKLQFKGLSKFTYGENYVIALNQKTADKKAKKLGYIS